MIRKFESKDINKVMQIWKKENIRTHKFIPEEFWEKNYSHVKEAISNAEIYVYECGDNIVGFIGINDKYIEGIFVDNNNQCKGVGTALLNKAKEGKDSLTLSVYKKNINAINFYKRNNFMIVSENIDKNTNEIEYVMKWNNNIEKRDNTVIGTGSVVTKDILTNVNKIPKKDV